MGATTLLPPSQPPRRTAALADLYSRTRRITINPSCMAHPAPAKNPKRPGPGSVRGGEPPAKRVRGAAEPHPAAAVSIGNPSKRPCPSSDKDLQSSKRLDSTVIKNQSLHLPIHPSAAESTAQVPKPSSTTTSMRDLIEKARQAKERPASEKSTEITRRRMEARRNLEQMVATVEFNDPFIDYTDVFMSRQQIIEARQSAESEQDRIIAMARGRELATD
jgi:hypothetical protein